MTENTAAAPARPARGADVDLRVDSMAHGGAGVGRLDGYVVFVRGAVPGDLVRATIDKRKRAYAEARLVEVLEPGPDRIEPRSPHPGAPWQVLPYERQLAIKEEQVRDALKRMGRFEDPDVAPIVGAVDQWRYRNKMEYSFGADEDGQLLLGFHRAGRWNDIDEVETDILAPEVVDEIRLAAKEWCLTEGLSAWDRVDHSGFLRNLVVRHGRRSGQIQARLITGDGEFRSQEFASALGADAVLWTRTPALSETSRDGVTKVLSGGVDIDEELEVGGRRLRFKISPEAFFQTNTEMAERLYGLAADAAGLTGAEKVFDLYCGIGTIGISLASRAREVWGIESVEHAIADAIRNAELNGVGNAKFFAGDVRTALGPLVEKAGKPDVVIVDPPRPGLSPKIVRRVLEAEPQRIVYVSCNPTTFAPNARQIVDAGYSLGRVTPVDMFPQTPHIECVAVLERNGAGR
ncbi:MAG: rRNA (uracil1939-C5)-methyltransferase [Thermoleophilaceae bacterium]|jgi:23S rRNA (uracil1939-C5)-methyltransferase|nr:rRNA (uracil1939-C5)-methyltransferase [Thermoleophilaceae bacterium]